MKIPWSIADKIMTAVSGIALLVSTIIFFINWSGLPDIVPTHFNIYGEADGYGGKGSLIVIVIIAWVLVGGVFAIEFFPRLWNMPVTITYSNEARVYRKTKSLLEWLKMIVAMMLSFFILNSVFNFDFMGAVTAVFIAGLIAVIIIYFIKILRLRNV